MARDSHRMMLRFHLVAPEIVSEVTRGYCVRLTAFSAVRLPVIPFLYLIYLQLAAAFLGINAASANGLSWVDL
jgi:hypothetical protein